MEGALIERAAAIADYTDTSVFVPERAANGEEVPPEWFGMNPDYGEDSAEVISSSTEEEDEAEDEGARRRSGRPASARPSLQQRATPDRAGCHRRRSSRDCPAGRPSA